MRTWSRTQSRTSVRAFDRAESGLPPVASDPSFYATTLLLPGNGTNGAQNNTFVDSSTNAFTITRNGNTTQGSFSPFSQTGWGNHFDGSGDYLSVADNAALDLGTGDFTIEGWVYIADGIADNAGIVSKRNNVAFNFGDYRISYRTGTGKITFADDLVNERATPVVQKNSWVHFAIVRESGTISAYADGVRGDTAADTVNLGNAEVLSIGANSPSLTFLGYISNVRIVKGTAVYSGATYTVPTTPLTAITNTSLLTCQSNRFIDNSTNSFAITANGDVSVQAFSPFNPTAAWSAATNGGSGYFDGTGDYLTVPNNAALQMGTGDFTIEFWWYPTSIANYQTPFTKGYNLAGGILLQTGSGDGKLNLWSGGGVVLTSSTAVTVNSWNHVALVRSGTSLVLYQNGVSVASAINSTNFNDTSTMGIGANGQTTGAASAGALPIVGYMTNLRIIKGTAAYTAAFTPPTAPLTAITNTSLLCNFTNAGIFDATAKNDLETVGNAQISTTQSKFGGSSMYFDGTGDKLLIRNIPELRFGTGDFTIEMWVYLAATGAYQALLEARASNTSTQYGLYISDVDKPYWYDGTSKTSSIVVSGSTWTHIAFVRSSGTLKIYVGGQEGFSGSFTADVSPTAVYGIGGRSFDNTTYLNGYIQDLRITKGVARYTAAFTPPTAAFPLS